MESKKVIDLFDSRIFWDVDFSNLDLDRDSSFIITRVFDRGDVPDIRNCRRYFGDEVITKVLLEAKHLSKHRLYLASAITEKPITHFRCYTSNPLIHGYSPY